jgi:hypothetical protein
MASKTGCASVGESPMTRRISLVAARLLLCLPQAGAQAFVLVRLRVRRHV